MKVAIHLSNFHVLYACLIIFFFKKVSDVNQLRGFMADHGVKRGKNILQGTVLSVII